MCQIRVASVDKCDQHELFSRIFLACMDYSDVKERKSEWDLDFCRQIAKKINATKSNSCCKLIPQTNDSGVVRSEFLHFECKN